MCACFPPSGTRRERGERGGAPARGAGAPGARSRRARALPVRAPRADRRDQPLHVLADEDLAAAGHRRQLSEVLPPLLPGRDLDDGEDRAPHHARLRDPRLSARVCPGPHALALARPLPVPARHAPDGLERHPDLRLARPPLERAGRGGGARGAVAALHGAAADDDHRDHPPLGRGGGEKPRRHPAPALPARAAAAEPTRARVRVAAGLQRVDQRPGDAGLDGRAQGAHARQPRLRRGPDLDELAVRLVDRRRAAGLHRRGDGRLPADDAGARPPRGGGMTRRLLLASVVAIYLFLLAPLLIVVAVSFDPTDAFRFPPRGVSLRWYAAFFASEMFVRAFFRVSLGVALALSVLATAVGGLAAIGLVRFLARGRALMETLFLTPLVVPEILLGAALFLYYSRLKLATSIAGLVLAHLLLAIPYVVRTVSAGLVGVDRSLEEAAMSLGASRAQAFWKVTMPLIRSSLLSAAIFAFIVSFSDINIALFVAGPDSVTLPVHVFSQIVWQADPTIAAASTLQIVLIAALLGVAQRAFRLRVTV